MTSSSSSSTSSSTGSGRTAGFPRPIRLLFPLIAFLVTFLIVTIPTYEYLGSLLQDERDLQRIQGRQRLGAGGVMEKEPSSSSSSAIGASVPSSSANNDRSEPWRSRINPFKKPSSETIARNLTLLSNGVLGVRSTSSSSEDHDAQLSLTLQQHSPFAYAYVMESYRPDDPESRGLLYNMMIARHILIKQGSQADMIVMIQIIPDDKDNKSEQTNKKNNSNSTLLEESTLSKNEAQWLNELGIRVHYYESQRTAAASSQHLFDKFQILALTQYERVMYLGSDVLPVCNLDYLFTLSTGDTPLLKENVILTGTREPAHHGLFLLRPNLQGLEHVQKQIQQWQKSMQKRSSATHPIVVGWGPWKHSTIQPSDPWMTNSGWNGTQWDFDGASTDQGMLYYYTKYYCKQVTIVKADIVENWAAVREEGDDDEQHVVLEKSLSDPFPQGNVLAKPSLLSCHQLTAGKGTNYGCPPPYNSYIHFTKYGAPLEYDLPLGHTLDEQRKLERILLWRTVLRHLNDQLEMRLPGLDQGDWSQIHLPRAESRSDVLMNVV